MTNPLELTHWAPFGGIAEIGSGFWRTLIFLVCMTFSIDPKIENNAKTMPREANVHCRIPAAIPREGLPGLQGGTPPVTKLGECKFIPALLWGYFFQCQFPHRILITFWRPFDANNSKHSSQNKQKCLPESIKTWIENGHGELQTKHENTMRKRNANTSQKMLLCVRGSFLSKSAGFKNIPEDV